MGSKFRLDVETKDYKDITVKAEGIVETEVFKVKGTIMRKVTLRRTLGWIIGACVSAVGIAAAWGWAT